MVTIEDNKIKIEIETASPEEDLLNIRCSLLQLLQYMDEDFYNQSLVYTVAGFINNLQPTFEQIRIETDGRKAQDHSCSIEKDSNNI